jgi:hypothetical protein
MTRPHGYSNTDSDTGPFTKSYARPGGNHPAY